MEFGRGSGRIAASNRRSLQHHHQNISENWTTVYPFALQLYDVPPVDSVSLQEFSEFAIERLKVLRIIERVRLKQVKSTQEYFDTLIAEIRKDGLHAFYKKTPDNPDHSDPADYADRRKDHISHFILRLAYCKTEELRRWFIKQETDLFQFRFGNESRKTISQFMIQNQLKFTPIPEHEKVRLHEKVRQVSYGEPSLSDSTDFYKVPFTEVLALVSKRRVYLEGGYGYIKIKDMSHIVTTHFRTLLSRALAVTARALPTLEEDTRLLPLLSGLHLRYVGQDYTNMSRADGSHEITRQMLDDLGRRCFPLCMRQLHEALRENHHLRHGGRLQYTLFLKGIGMSLEEVLAMWREEFTKIMDGDKFDRQYAYNVRHSFGKEGKRVSYTPYTCMKVIMGSTPSTGDHHGCPFRHSDPALLQQQLGNYKVPLSHVREIMDLVSKGHYQIACSRYFESVHRTTLKQSVNHPNQYFEESYRLVHGLPDSKPDSVVRQSEKTHPSTKVLPPTSVDEFGDDDFDCIMATIE